MESREYSSGFQGAQGRLLRFSSGKNLGCCDAQARSDPKSSLSYGKGCTRTLSLLLQDILDQKSLSNNSHFLPVQGHFSLKLGWGCAGELFHGLRGSQVTPDFQRQEMLGGAQIFWKSTIKPGRAHGTSTRKIPGNYFPWDRTTALVFLASRSSGRVDVEQQNSTILEQDPDSQAGVWVWREITRIPWSWSVDPGPNLLLCF